MFLHGVNIEFKIRSVYSTGVYVIINILFDRKEGILVKINIFYNEDITFWSLGVQQIACTS